MKYCTVHKGVTEHKQDMEVNHAVHEFFKILKILQKEGEDTAHLSRFSEEKVRSKVHQECQPNLRNRVLDEFSGNGPLTPLINDPEVTEIVIDGKDNIFYEKKTKLKKHPDHFFSKWTFENFIHRLCASAKINPNLDAPFADGKWGSFRVHIIIPPLTCFHPHITLRKHPKEIWTFKKLQQNGWASLHVIELIREIIGCRMNILIAGPTSSGKTSVLNACLQEVSAAERVVVIEDTDELALPNSFCVKLLTRFCNHMPNVDQTLLVKQSLRMRPDRLVLGEVRDAAAKDLVMALATGHSGSMGTLHAHNHKQALLRLELLVQSGSVRWDSRAIRNMIHHGIQIIFIVKKEKGLRYLQSIHQITNLESTGFLFETLFQHQTQIVKPLLTHKTWSLGHQA